MKLLAFILGVLALSFTSAGAVSPTGVLTQDGAPTTDTCLKSTAPGFAGSAGFPCANPNNYRRYLSQANFYASPGGDAGGECLSAASPCSLQRAIDVAMYYDSAHYNVDINLAGGTYTTGVKISGKLHGSSGGGVSYFTLRGTGRGSTILDSTACGNQSVALDMGAVVTFESMTIQHVTAYQTPGGSCDQSALTVVGASTAYYGNDFQIGPAGWAGVYLSDRSSFRCKGGAPNIPFYMYGGSRNYGFIGSGGTSIQLCAGSWQIIQGGYYPTFIDLIDASSFNPGINSTFYSVYGGSTSDICRDKPVTAGGPTVVCATGTKFFAVVNSYIDLEHVFLYNMPGNASGHVGLASSVLNNSGSLGACGYGQNVNFYGICPLPYAPYGLGSGGYYRMPEAPAEFGGGASGWAGKVEIQVGSSPSGVGYVYVWLPYALQGPTNNGGLCIAGPGLSSGGSDAWPEGSTFRTHYGNGTNFLLIWYHSSGINPGWAYYIDYLCH